MSPLSPIDQILCSTSVDNPDLMKNAWPSLASTDSVHTEHNHYCGSQGAVQHRNQRSMALLTGPIAVGVGHVELLVKLASLLIVE